MTHEGVVSKVLKERMEDLLLSTKGNNKKFSMVEDGKGEVVLVDRSYETISEDIEWACNGMEC